MLGRKKRDGDKHDNVNGKCWARKSNTALTGLSAMVPAIIRDIMMEYEHYMRRNLSYQNTFPLLLVTPQHIDGTILRPDIN